MSSSPKGTTSDGPFGSLNPFAEPSWYVSFLVLFYFVEWDAFHDLIVIDELARCGYLGVNWGLSCGNVIGCPPIINYGSAAQKEKFLPPMLRGETKMCLAVTEPQGN